MLRLCERVPEKRRSGGTMTSPVWEVKIGACRSGSQ